VDTAIANYEKLESENGTLTRGRDATVNALSKVGADSVGAAVSKIRDLDQRLSQYRRTHEVQKVAGDVGAQCDAQGCCCESCTTVPVPVSSASAVYDIRMGDWKLVERAGAPQFESVRNKRKSAQAARKQRAAPKKNELYNLRDDPAEEMNLAASHAKRMARMKQFLVDARERGFTRPGAEE
jgi:hypothetical protein